jgi:hypothetical protein
LLSVLGISDTANHQHGQDRYSNLLLLLLPLADHD